MAVKTKLDGGMHVLVYQVEAMCHVVAVHASQRVHNVEGIGVQLVHSLHQLQQFHIAVEDCADRLHEHFIPFFHENPGPVDSL